MPRTQSHYLAVCAAFRNEGPYLSEWIEYHRHIGVDHFFLYDNASTDDFRSILDRYDSGTITLSSREGRGRQLDCYNDCIAVHGRKTFWLAFIDLDEFLVPSRGESVAQVLQAYEHRPGLGLNWHTFGSGGKTFFRPQPVSTRFTRRAPGSWEMNRHVKIVARTENLVRASHCHVVEFAGGQLCHTTGGEALTGPHSERPDHSRLSVFHYPVKSFEEFRWKAARGRGATASSKRSHAYFRLNDRNDVVDETLKNLVSRIADRIERPEPLSREPASRVALLHLGVRVMQGLGRVKRRFRSAPDLQSE